MKRLPLIILFVAFGFYLYTLAPVVTFVDSGELAAVIGTRGVAHPPGFPLYLLIGSIVALIPFGTLIWRLNAFSAICGAISVFLTYKAFLEIAKTRNNPAPKIVEKKKKTKGHKTPATVPSKPAIEIPWLGASAAAFAWMTNRALWNTATVTEVYALHALLVVSFCFLLVSYSHLGPRYLALAALVAGLALSNYPPFGLLAPGALFYFYRIEKRTGLKDWKQKLRVALLLAAGLLPYIMLPVRAKLDPLLNWGNPSNWDLFWRHISAAQYKIFLGAPNFEVLPKAFSLWLDQWPLPIWLLILPGMIFLWRLRPDESYLLLITGVTNIFYVLSYDITDVSSAPSDFYTYLLPLCWVSAIWIGCGAQWIILILPKRINSPRIFYAVAALLILVIPAATAFSFWKTANRRDYFYADDFARAILQALPQNSLVFSPDWTFVSPALYLQHVEKIRPDVVVLDTELLRRSWYFGYLKKRAPWLMETSQKEITEFLTELIKYEENQPFSPDLTTQKYVAMLNHFLSEGNRLQHPPHVLLNLEAKEEDPAGYAQWESLLHRPPFVTVGVMPNAIGEKFQWVPESLAFRLYADNKFHLLPPITIPPRKLDPSREYDPVTRGVIERYAEFWKWRADYLTLHGQKPVSQ